MKKPVVKVMKMRSMRMLVARRDVRNRQGCLIKGDLLPVRCPVPVMVIDGVLGYGKLSRE